ncbi:KAP family P-loop NTPase fold protein [Vibrio parahaemolyticus]|nr:hypothetical protein [Vibrio parahaemolyticus]
MPNLHFDNAKYSEWKDSHNFDNCKLNRKEYGNFIADYITGEHDGFVLNLNGTWGTGKTEFLKRTYTELISRGHPCIYVDAWESDFSKDPLTVVTSELLKQLQLFNFDINGEEAGRNLHKFFAKALKGTAIGVAGGLTKYLVGDSTIGASTMQEWLNQEPGTYIDTITNEYHEQVEAIKEIRLNLTSLANILQSSFSAHLPVVVLVDELDRCRPTYAIEMLEVIKHFFNTKNFVFVVATDSEQLSRSIKAVYGSEFESKAYLKRFFDRKATLPAPEIEDYLTACEYEYSTFSTLKLYPNIYQGTQEQAINKTISLLAMAYNLTIRDIDQLISKFHSCLRSAVSTSDATGKRQYINYPALLIGLIEQEKSEEIYNERSIYRSPDSIIQNQDYKISQEFTLNQFVQMSMRNITLRETRSINQYREERISYSLRGHVDFRDDIHNSMTDEYRQFLQETSSNLQYGIIDGNHKHWNWDDMKKVIELAGTLE